MNENIIAFISALTFYALPALTGRGICGLLKIRTRFLPFVTYLILGFLSIFSGALVIQYIILPFYPNLTFPVIFRLFLVALIILSVIANMLHLPKNLISRSGYLLPVLSAIVLSVIASAIWNFNSPYSLNWDMYEHQTLVNTILSGRFSYVTSQISDTFGFNGYSSILHSVLTAAQLLIPADIILFWSYLSLIHTVLVAYASYIFADSITQNKSISFVSMILGTFIFESTVTFTTFFFMPQTFTSVIGIFLISQLINELKAGQFPSISSSSARLGFIFLNHYIVGTLIIAVYLALIFYFRYTQKVTKLFRHIILGELGLILLLSILVLSPLIPLASLNQSEGAFFTFTPMEKFSFMQSAYGYSLLLFLPLGMLYALKGKNNLVKFILFLTFGILTIIIAQLPYVLKFYALGRFFVHLFIAIGIWGIIRQIHPIIRYISIGFLIFVLSSILATNALYWKNILNYENTLTNISVHDVDASEFLKKTYQDKNILLISDPATQNILEGLSGINSPGGAYSSPDIRNELHYISQATDAARTAASVYNIADRIENKPDQRLLVLSGRYFVWQKASLKEKQAFYYNIWGAIDLTYTNLKYIQNLVNNISYFKLIYQNPALVILEVKLPS